MKHLHPVETDQHLIDLEKAEAEARDNQFTAMEELLESIARHEDIPAQWLRFRDTQADANQTRMFADERRFAVAADREIRRLTRHCIEEITKDEATS